VIGNYIAGVGHVVDSKDKNTSLMHFRTIKIWVHFYNAINIILTE
jgi:hypothetical protein